MENPFTFGGGLHRGGFKEHGIKLLAPLFSFDYMGAAEFEFGAVPQAFSYLLQDYCDGTLIFSKIGLNRIMGCGSAYNVYYMCRQSDNDDVVKFIKKCNSGKVFTKEPVLFRETIRELVEKPKEKWYSRYIGWVALGDEPFAWFIDENAWNGMKVLFESLKMSVDK
jgi:hypothetical protein